MATRSTNNVATRTLSPFDKSQGRRWNGRGTILSFTFMALCALVGTVQIDFAFGAEMKAAGESEWTKTVAAGKKEGKLAVFLFQRENIEAAVRAFEKKFPEIQLTVAATPAAETGPRIMAE